MMAFTRRLSFSSKIAHATKVGACGWISADRWNRVLACSERPSLASRLPQRCSKKWSLGNSAAPSDRMRCASTGPRPPRSSSRDPHLRYDDEVSLREERVGKWVVAHCVVLAVLRVGTA